MTTVAALQSDIANILSRDDIGGDFAMHLRLAHARINRDVRCRAMVKWQATNPYASNARDEAETAGANLMEVDITDLFGDGYGPLIGVHTVAWGLGGEKSALDAVSQEMLLEHDYGTAGTRPCVYALATNQAGEIILWLAPTPPNNDMLVEVGNILTITCWFGFELDSENPLATNWLLTNHYDVYLYALAAAACGTLQDFERQAQYLGMYQAAVAELAKTENQARTGGSVIERRSVDSDGYRV